jgi:hypothetical protein
MTKPLLISTTGNSSSSKSNRQEASSSIRQNQCEVSTQSDLKELAHMSTQTNLEQSSPQSQSQMIGIEGATLSTDLIKFPIMQHYSISASKDSSRLN